MDFDLDHEEVTRVNSVDVDALKERVSRSGEITSFDNEPFDFEVTAHNCLLSSRHRWFEVDLRYYTDQKLRKSKVVVKLEILSILWRLKAKQKQISF